MTATHQEDYGDYYSSKKQRVLSMFLPREVVNAQVSKPTTKATYTYTITYEFSYDGKNAKEIKVRSASNYPGDEVYTATITYSAYDKNNNPFYGGYNFGDLEGEMSFSKNNPTKYSIRDSDGDYYEYEYSYTYDGKYPKEATERAVSGGGYFYTTFYEYTK